MPAPQNRAGICLAALAVALALFVAVASQLQPRVLDLEVYWQAAQRSFDAGIDPYPRRDGDGLPFTYPPTALFLLYPLSQLDLADSARLLWSINIALAPLLMVLLVRDLARTTNVAEPGRPPLSIAGGRLLRWGPPYIAVFGGVYLTLVFHQINLPILLCLWLFWRAVRTGAGGYGAGTALALGSVAKPHYGLLLLATFDWHRWAGRQSIRRLRPLVGAAIAGLALMALSLVLAPPGSWASWLALVPGATSYTELPAGHSSIAAPWNRSLPGQIARFLVPNKFTDPLLDSPSLAAWLSTGLAVLLFTTSALAIHRSWPAPPAGAGDADTAPVDPVAMDLRLSVLSVAIFLAAPASWTHHLVMLLPAALVLLREAVLAPGEPPGGRFTAALVLLVLALTLDDLIPREVRTSSQAIMGLMTVAVCALWLLLVQRLVQRTRNSG